MQQRLATAIQKHDRFNIIAVLTDNQPALTYGDSVP